MSKQPLNPALVAVIEDELPIRRFVRAALLAAGYRVREAATARDAQRLLEQEPPDVAVLDLGLPDRDGLELIREVRLWSAVPIVVLSARDQEDDKIEALDAGADDYLTKPFGVGELLARLRVALRHRTPGAGGTTVEYRLGNVQIDLTTRRILRDGQLVKLTRHEFALLEALLRHAGRVITHRSLLREVWGPHCQQETHYLRVYIANLRKKLEPEPARPQWILTEQGVGYRMVLPE
ncbi:MAG: response regulator [Fimbriimonadaceae bacterium]|nr:response regulator [Fimbriimonadaceae bacterium]